MSAAHTPTIEPKQEPAATPRVPPRPPKPALPPRPSSLSKKPRLPPDDPLSRPLPEIPRRPELPTAAHSDHPIYIVPGDKHSYQSLTSYTRDTLPAYATVQLNDHSSDISDSGISQRTAQPSSCDEASTERATNPEGKSEDLLLNAQVNALKERVAALECRNEELASEVSSLRSDVAKTMQLVELFTQKRQQIEHEPGESHDEQPSTAESTVPKQEHNRQYLASLSSTEV